MSLLSAGLPRATANRHWKSSNGVSTKSFSSTLVCGKGNDHYYLCHVMNIEVGHLIIEQTLFMTIFLYFSYCHNRADLIVT